MNYEINNIVKYKIYGDYIALYSLEYNGSVVYEEKDLIKTVVRGKEKIEELKPIIDSLVLNIDSVEESNGYIKTIYSNEDKKYNVIFNATKENTNILQSIKIRQEADKQKIKDAKNSQKSKDKKAVAIFLSLVTAAAIGLYAYTLVNKNKNKDVSNLSNNQTELVDVVTETTQLPTQAPTQAPTKLPTQAPTQAPTQLPTQAPTQAPTPTLRPLATKEVLELLNSEKEILSNYRNAMLDGAKKEGENNIGIETDILFSENSLNDLYDFINNGLDNLLNDKSSSQNKFDYIRGTLESGISNFSKYLGKEYGLSNLFTKDLDAKARLEEVEEKFIEYKKNPNNYKFIFGLIDNISKKVDDNLEYNPIEELVVLGYAIEKLPFINDPNIGNYMEKATELQNKVNIQINVLCSNYPTLNK